MSRPERKGGLAFLPTSINWLGLALVVGCVTLWEIASRTLGSEFTTLASLSETVSALIQLAVTGPLLEQLFHTLNVALSGWIIACVIGLALGIAVGMSRTVWTYTMASIDVLRSIPSISLVSIALMLFGFSPKMEMVIVVYVSQWPMLLATIGGIRATSPDLIDVSRTFHLSRPALLFKIIVPSALPNILVGMRLSLSLAIALAVVAEMVGNPAGLGFGLVFSQQAIQPAQAFAYLLVIGLVGWSLNAVFVAVVRHGFDGYGPIV